MIYKPDIRINNPIYLLKQVEELLKIATTHKNSSSLIYASLECRIALELMDLNFLLHSVTASEREQIIIDSKPFKGIDRVNRKVGVLKQKYQYFLQCVCELLDVGIEYYDYKKSKDLQYKVSTYIHSYHMTNEELEYESEDMKICYNLILEVDEFIKSSLPEKDGTYTMIGMEIASMPEEDRQVLNDWKTSNTMTYEEMKEILSENIRLRREKTE
ncbi:hypothetical protein [Aquimarina sediminis]|uniref:hypothetical protein n=1 Tax=Aquimarina sediminis TaxID=2070536 RepID=UPI000C9FFF6D|nr:hypothetical protein [Aquimarina sediminis]